MELEFVKELEAYKAEIEELEIKELLVNINKSKVDKLLNNDESKAIHGNRVVSTFNELCKVIDEVSIDTVMKECNCTRQQAITKLALAWNIRVVEGKGKWFKQQLNIISNNRMALANIDKEKYPLLYKQMTGRTKKYYDFMLDLYQCRLEACGLFYLGCNKPLVASASFRFMAKAPSLSSGVDTVEKNINNLARYGLIKKLTDEELMEIDTNQYEKSMKLKSKIGNTINSFMLIEWSDEVLATAEEHIAYGKNHGITNKSQNNVVLSAHGYDVANKGADSLKPEDTEDYAKLEKWARNKFRSDKAVITNKEFERKFYEIDAGKTYSIERSKKLERFRALLIARLDLIQVMASKANRALFGGINSKKFQGIAPNSKMLVKRTIYEQLTKH